MRAFIYVGGKVCPENVTEHPKNDDIRIAADSGYNNAVLLGERVDIFVGDGDSYRGKLPDGIETVPLKPEKDLTDTEVAVELALSRGCDDIVIIGGLSGRLDHTMSNLGILVDAKRRKFHCYIADGANRVRYLENDSLLVAVSGYKYISLIAATDVAKGVDFDGVRYPLKNAKLTNNVQYAVSNELTGNCAFVSVRKGGLFIIESKDVQ